MTNKAFCFVIVYFLLAKKERKVCYIHPSVHHLPPSAFLLISARVWSDVRHRLRRRGGTIISLVCEAGSISVITSH